MKVKFNKNSTFTIDDVKNTSYLYFPITNGRELKGAITPTLNGDLKIDQNHFALLPVSQEDLQNGLIGRHFWLNIDGYGLYNAGGLSARQKFQDNDEISVEAGFLYHTVKRVNKDIGLEVSITTFSPYGNENIELTKVTIKNLKKEPLKIVPTVAVPLYSRSADNIRDHRHVTALLNRVKIVQNGIINKPTLSFDERGHLVNEVSYGVFINSENNEQVKAYNPKLQDFMGEGGSLDWPKSLSNQQIGAYQVGDIVEGYEAIGAMQLEKITIDNTYSYVFAISIDENGGEFNNILEDYCNIPSFNRLLIESQNKWDEQLSTFEIKTSDESFDHWVKWISLQPTLRRIFGCSFLPHHDYGRGGRGWRDLWQDCLALLLMDSNEVSYLLYNNFGGVRLDGSNATIIGDKPGEFIADRNNIPRVWMDHGVWPWNTTKLYIERTGDVDFLFKKQSYFKDSNIFLCKEKDEKWSFDDGNKHLTTDKKEYQGTILEHILIENLVPFFNVGEHNNMRLEGADWNDGLDMARNKGESVTFTAFYMMNLKQIAEMLEKIDIESIEVASEITHLIFDDLNYNDVASKKDYLNQYFELAAKPLSGKVEKVQTKDLIQSLKKKANWIEQHIRKNEWIDFKENEGWFNGYYDDHGKKLEGFIDNQVKLTLTSQVFPIMSGVATHEHIDSILNASKKYLYDQKVGGYRLNTNFNEVKLDMGRLFGFAYGHKENGAMFSHMAMMFANGLYKRDFISDGYQIINDIYNHCINFEQSKIYPGIPEYIDMDGRGMYHYLTGSASWFILNVVDEMFGVKGRLGDLYLNPKLLNQQFSSNKIASITTEFNHLKLTIQYKNINNKEFTDYRIHEVFIDGKSIDFNAYDKGVIIDKKYLYDKCRIEVHLG